MTRIATLYICHFQVVQREIPKFPVERLHSLGFCLLRRHVSFCSIPKTTCKISAATVEAEEAYQPEQVGVAEDSGAVYSSTVSTLAAAACVFA